MRRIVIASIVVGALVAPVASATVIDISDPSGESASSGDPLFLPGQVVVRYDRGTDAGERADARGQVRGEVAQRLEVNRAQLLELPEGTSVRDAVGELSTDPAVEFAEPNYVYHADAIPTDTFFSRQWGMDNTGQTISTPNAIPPDLTFPGTADADIDAPEGWDIAPVEGGNASSVVVAMVDTGVAYGSPDLAPNMWRNPGETPANGIDDDANGFVDDVFGADFQAINQRAPTAHPCNGSVPPVCTDSDPNDDGDSGHGTHTAGIVGARGSDGYGVTGVSQKVQLMAVKVFDAFDRSSTVSVSNGFAYAASEGAKVVNASLGGPCPSALQAATIQANPDVLWVFSAGNGGDDPTGDNNDINDDANDEFTPVQCGSGTGALEHPGQYPCNFNNGPEGADFVPPSPGNYDFNNVVCVASSTNTDVKSSFSNYGPTSVQIAAPGSQVLSTAQAFRLMLGEDAEDPGFDNRLVDGGGTPITSATNTNWQRVPGFLGSFSLSETPFPGTNYPANMDVVARPATQVATTGRTGCQLGWTLNIAQPDNGDTVRLLPRNGATPFSIGLNVSGTGTATFTFPVPELNNQPDVGWQVQFVSDADATVAEGARIDHVGLFCQSSDYTPDRVDIHMDGTHQFLNGTSMATPMVAGAAALIREKARALTPAQVIQRLMAGGDPNAAFVNPGPTPVESGKRLNLVGALNAGSQPLPAAPAISGPEGLINQNNLAYTFTTDLAGARFQCAFDAGAFGDCTTATGFAPASPLADGAHELRVRAIGGEGGVSPTSTRAVTVDTVAPETTVTGGPINGSVTSDSTPTFDFASSEAGSSFVCRVDANAFAPCTSGAARSTSARAFTPPALGNGPHTFEVQATDPAGNQDASSATSGFTVDATGPAVTITKGPKKKTTKKKATFEFRADETVTFTCQLDKKPAAPCTSPAKVKAKKGKHTFVVVGTDAVGNKGQASLKWKVKKKRKRR